MRNPKSNIDRLASLKNYVELLESKFTFPGTNFKFGIDPLLNFIPGIGSYSGLILGLVFIILALIKVCLAKLWCSCFET